ncbi:LOW QUALITY PROTEIN: uncharacterized protein EMH_0069350 [Eimeria mitis]|uniref:Uncharacterized protein n=1 Tax=Eimeria mitis TaxID=44415 RepID=U6KAM3_9EIME|nr:LOW QUALITY PROTEIN: uncharacterized protein EMH_0069350 [Eimeria mitis]CDJ34994.1 hypothetical protein, conserved [Eimeria mitis]
MPALEVVEGHSRTEELGSVKGARTSPGHVSHNAHVGLRLPTQLKARPQHAQHVHGKGLPDHFSTASICGNLVGAAAEHPEELSPQSALQKKTPSGLNGHCHTEEDGPSGVSGPNKQLHLSSTPVARRSAPSNESTHDEAAAGLQVRPEKQLSEVQQTNHMKWMRDNVAQSMEAAPERTLSIFSQEELLEGAEKHLDVAGNAVAAHGTRGQDMEKQKDAGQSSPATANPEMRILRSKTVTGPVLNISRVSRDIPLRRETTLVQWNQHKSVSPSVDSSRGRRKTGTPVGCQSVRRTQSDVRGLCSAAVNAPTSFRTASEILTEDLYASVAVQWRGISASRRSPQRLKEHLVTRNTPENHLPSDPVSAASLSRSEEGANQISANVKHIRLQIRQAKQAASNKKSKCYAATASDHVKNSLGNTQENTFILFSSGCRSRYQGQACQVEMSSSTEQGVSAKQLSTMGPEPKGSICAERIRGFQSCANQTTNSAHRNYEKLHKEHLSFSSQLHKRLNRRPTARRLRQGKYGGTAVVEKAVTGDGALKDSSCNTINFEYGGTAVVEKAATGDGAFKESNCNTISLGRLSTASTTGVYEEKRNPQDKATGTYREAAEHTPTVQQLENYRPTSSPQKISLNSFLAPKSLVEDSVGERCAAPKACGKYRNEGAAQSGTTCKDHRMEVSVPPCNPHTLNRRAASCIESGSHGLQQVQPNGSQLRSSPQRVSRSLSWSARGAENAQTTVVPLRQPGQVKLRTRLNATCSQCADTQSTEGAVNEQPQGSRRRLSLGYPSRNTEATPVIHSLGSPTELSAGTSIDSTIGAVRATSMRVDLGRPHDEPNVLPVSQGELWTEGHSKRKRLMDAISPASSHIPQTQLRQTSGTNIPPQLLLDSRLIGDGSTAPLLREPGAEAGVGPHTVPLRLEMAIQGHFTQASTRDEAVNASNGIRAVPHFLKPHIVNHPQAMLLTGGGGQTTLSPNGRPSGHPVIQPVGLSQSCFWVAPGSVLLSHLDGWSGYTDGKPLQTGSGSRYLDGGILHFGSIHVSDTTLRTHCCTSQAGAVVNAQHLGGGASNCADENPFLERQSGSQKEFSALTSVVGPYPAFPAPVHTQGISQEHTQKDNYCQVSDDSGLNAANSGSIPHGQAAAGVPASGVASVPEPLRRDEAHSLNSVACVHRCSGVMCYCSGMRHEHTFCHTPVLCNHQMRETVQPAHYRGTLFRRCYLPRALQLKEEALKWRIHSRRKQVQLLNKQITIQQQQLKQALQLQQTHFQQTLNQASFLGSRLNNDRTFKKNRFRRSIRQRSLSHRKANALCSQEGPTALLEAAAAATAAALAVVGVCEQRAHKLIAGSQTSVPPIGDSAQGLGSSSQREGSAGVTTGGSSGLQQQLLITKLPEEAQQDIPGISPTPRVNGELAQLPQDDVLLRSRGSNMLIAKELQRCLASFQEADDSFTRPSQDLTHKRGNTLQLQLALPQRSQPDPTEKLQIGQPDLGGPMLPRAASEPTCPKLAIGLELSFPSPGMFSRGTIDDKGSYSRVEVTLAPSLPNIRSSPVQTLQTTTNASPNWEGSSGERKTEPSDFLPDVEGSRKRNGMPMTNPLIASCRSLSGGRRISRVVSRNSSRVIRSSSSGKRGNIHANACSNKTGDIPVVKGLHGTPGRYRCNAVPMAYHRDPSISIFSQLL